VSRSATSQSAASVAEQAADRKSLKHDKLYATYEDQSVWSSTLATAKIQISFTRSGIGSPGNRPLNGCVCVPCFTVNKDCHKVTPLWILLKQETVSGSGISWDICKSAHRSRQITMPAPHHLVFLQAGCPSCHPTNSVKALKASIWHITHSKKICLGLQRVTKQNIM